MRLMKERMLEVMFGSTLRFSVTPYMFLREFVCLTGPIDASFLFMASFDTFFFDLPL